MDTETAFDRAVRASLRLNDVRDAMSADRRQAFDGITLEALGYGRGYLDAHNNGQPANSDLALWFACEHACEWAETRQHKPICEAWQAFLRRVGHRPVPVVRVDVTVRGV